MVSISLSFQYVRKFGWGIPKALLVSDLTFHTADSSKAVRLHNHAPLPGSFFFSPTPKLWTQNFAVVFMFKIISKILTPLQVICAISMHLLGQNLRCGGKSILEVVIQDYHLNHNNVLGSWSWYIQLLFANPNLPFLHCK